jgi:hypothetical protein
MGDQSFDRYLQSVAMFAFVIEVFCQRLDSRFCYQEWLSWYPLSKKPHYGGRMSHGRASDGAGVSYAPIL